MKIVILIKELIVSRSFSVVRKVVGKYKSENSIE